MKRNQTAEKSILEAAERLFLEKGFALTSTIMIAKEVGCNQSLVHYYYRSKEKLFQLVIEKYLLIFINSFPTIGDKELTFEEHLKHYVYTQFEMLQTNPDIVLFLFNEFTINSKRLLTFKEQFKIFFSNFIQVIERELQIEINTGNIQPISAIDLMLNVLSLNAGVFLFYFVVKKLEVYTPEELKTLIEKRKEENYRMILTSIL